MFLGIFWGLDFYFGVLPVMVCFMDVQDLYLGVGESRSLMTLSPVLFCTVLLVHL